MTALNPTIDSFGRDYLRLVLSIDRHIDGYIDAYYGPPELKAEVAAEPREEAAALRDQLERLSDEIPVDNETRHRYAEASLRAIDCTIRMLEGEEIDYLDEVRRIYDIRPVKVDESRFEQAQQTLDQLLPNDDNGLSLAGRLDRWREQFQLPAPEAVPLFEIIREEVRQRTRALIELPAGEAVEIRLTNNQPWSAYNWYLGNGRSLIEINTDMPLQLNHLLGLLAHEGYPGHHTEQSVKERLLYREKGYAEQAALLLHSPSAVIAEGIATTALEMIFPDDSDYDWNADVLFPAAGRQFASDIATQMRAVAEAAQTQRYVSGNAAILLHTGKLNADQALDYIITYGLSTPERAQKSLSFITHPLYRSYPFTYTVGYDLIAAAPDKRDTFLRLLTTQSLPSDLSGWKQHTEAK